MSDGAVWYTSGPMAEATLPLRTRVLNVLRSPLRARPVDALLSRATQGKAPSSFVARLAPGNGLYPRPSLRSVVRRGIRYELDVSDFMEWVIYFGIVTEPRDTLFALTKPGDVVLDIGANVGECALNFARNVGAKGRVLSFEPDPVVRAKLERNIALNSFANIDVLPFALGDRAATLTLSTPTSRNRGGNRIVEGAAGNDHVDVQVVRLDDVVEQQKLDRVDLVKIDVEGYEVKAFRGAEAVIRRFRPTLFVEVSDENLREAGSSANELVGLLAEWGYSFRSADDGSVVSPADSFAGRHFDVIATAK